MTDHDENRIWEREKHWCAAGCLIGSLAVAAAIVIALLVILATMAEGAEVSDELTGLADRIEADQNAPEWKRELIRHAVAHGDEVQTFRAHTLYYHPREAGVNWRRWKGTATGTLVRPGVASCTVAHRGRWMGAWIWFKGHGLCKVEDVFPESSSRNMFDLAVWAKPGQGYESWLWDPTRVVIARTRNVYTTALVIKPRGGWD